MIHAKKPYDYEELLPHEIFWRDHASLLMDHGYQLRPRFRPGWIPSWKGTGKKPFYFEDSELSALPQTIDAVRVQDNRDVFLKRIPKGSMETKILIYLSDPKFSTDPYNHTVPLLDLITDDKEYDFIVMPLLRRFNNPLFVSVDEVVDFMRQSLEGLVFLHRVGVAHRDCSDLNIMFDATAMYPQGFHPFKQFARKGGTGLIRDSDHYNRGDVLSTIIYYYIDFGISSLFTDPLQHRAVTGIDCQDKSVPELSYDKPYDPFKTDVYILGNVFKTNLVDKYSNLAFLLPLTIEMTKWDPKYRPTAETCLAKFREILHQQRKLSLRWMLLESNLSSSQLFRRNAASLVREVRRSLKKLVGWPLGAVFLSSLTFVSFVYGPRNIFARIRHIFSQLD